MRRQTRSLAPLGLATLIACTNPSMVEGSGSASESAGESGSESETGDENGALTCDDPPILPPSSSAPIPWQTLAEVELGEDGSSSSLSIPVAAGQRYLAIRTVAVDGEVLDNQQLCHDLLEARLVDQDLSLIPAEDEDLLDTHQRRLPRPGAGIFVFSNTETPLLADSSDTVEVRLQMRHCLSQTTASRAFFPGMPTRIRVDVASEPAAPVARLAVRMLIADDSGWGTVDEDPELADAWAVAVERFAAAGIALELDAVGQIPAVGELRYEATMLPLRTLHQQALACLRRDEDDERFVPVILVPCLRLDEPGSSSSLIGHTPHVPGLFDESSEPSLVVLASNTCVEGSEPTLGSSRYGLILAHEIGHYLGLHHSDTSLGAHLDAGPETALMNAGIVTESLDPLNAWFSPIQAEVLRRHPDVVAP